MQENEENICKKGTEQDITKYNVGNHVKQKMPDSAYSTVLTLECFG